MSSNEDRTYRVDVPVLTTDNVELILEVDVTLNKHSGGMWNPPKTWLDNVYRPEIISRVQSLAARCTEAQIKNNPDAFRSQLQHIANNVCDQLPLPQ
jgi:hypothetical protein